MMRARLAVVLSLLAAPALAQLQAVDATKRPTCTDGQPWAMWLLNESSATDCDKTAGGAFEALCCCKEGSVAACASAGGGGNSFETIDLPSGTDPVADSATDTLAVTCSAPLTCTGNSGTDTWALAWSSTPLISTDIDTSAELRGILTDETGTGAAVFVGCANCLGGTEINESGLAAVPTATALAANPGDCSTGDGTEFAWRINASGDLSCASVAFEPYSDVLDIKNTAADTPDDDFSSGSLAGKWTVVSGASGTVDLFETGTSVAEYDLATRSGWLLLQVGKNSGNAVSLRQDYTLPDGSSIVAALAVNSGGSNAAVTTNNSLDCGLNVNNNNTSAVSGTYTGLYLDAQAALGPRPLVVSSVGSTLNGPDSWVPLGGVAWLRISRVGLNYSHFVSADSGLTWFPLGIKTLGSAADNVWVYCSMDATITGQVPISGFDWVRLGTNKLDPW